MNSKTRPAHILPVILFSQLAGTSLWFAGNAVILDLQRDRGIAPESLAYVTSAVQLGFVCGTLLFAILMISDRFSPPPLFLSFLITIHSIQLADFPLQYSGVQYVFWLLLPGPVIGLWMLRPVWIARDAGGS